MGNLLLLVIVAVAAAALLAIARRYLPHFTPPRGGSEARTERLPFTRKELVSPAERSFYGVLERVVGGSCRIFAKVRLADLIAVRSGMDKGERMRSYNKISRKHVDFVICSPRDLAVLAVVELDDASHKRPDRARRDDFVDRALGAANIATYHVPVKSAYVVDDVRKVLTSLIPTAATADRSREPSAASPEQDDVATEPLAARAHAMSEAVDGQGDADSDATPPCPRCGRPLVARVSAKGPRMGETFLGCTGFPNCRYTAAAS